MSTDLKELARELAALPVESRAFLLDQLWASLNNSLDPKIDAAWLEEAEHRWEGLVSGEVEAVPAEQVMKDARATLRTCP
ncbi:addiction module protein [Pedosphaera parvula]|uniref:Addiction module component, TIGR02574 family n=1 Tax=Pedosphaera parvula (strain Ellin514) TaxID=320771 RepID=B9XSN3_PEDPL|nr:addiction module protein [Pedosphaera parvula]EEF57152.1 addiction module component, TIGR02574 family [Pedosphaera parvula Ellin514]